jgi:acetolactate synthase-1/2/3 large subunit
MLRRLGVTQAFGVMGGAIAPFFHTLAHSEITTLHFRHECGAAFAAIEASLASRRPVLVFTTTGPGLTNAFTGMVAARGEGAHLIFVSGATPAALRHRGAAQEASVAADACDLSTTIEHPAQLGPILAQLAGGLTRPNGFVAHIALPIDIQRTACATATAIAHHAVPECAPEVIASHAARFAAEPPLLWLGFGARHAAGAIRQLVERLGARVMCTPRAKGIFPEDHPRFLGVTGIASTIRSGELAERPACTLVLGTRLGEAASFWNADLTPRGGFVHVDVDATAFGAAYPNVVTEGVVAEIGRYVDALLAELGPRPAVTVTDEPAPPERIPTREGNTVRPQQLMAGLQRVVVEGSDAWLMAESGNAFCWSTHHLRYREPGRYRMSTRLGSMGHAACSVVGAALARRGKAFALVGDGAMMMLNELHSAVQYKADAVWVILNDACYLMCAQGMRVMGWEPFHCELPRVDFVALARAVGADGERLERETDIDAALARALAARGPWVLDVAIDPREVPPSGGRNRSLMQQQGGTQ